jgi:chemotaxis protein CheD
MTAVRLPTGRGISTTRESLARRSVYLHPGHVYASTTPSRVTTILGSCVALTLWDSRLRIGGINHYLIPQAVRSSMATARIGSKAIESLMEGLARLGSSRLDLEAGVFGGACLHEAFRRREHLGDKNVALALEWLDRARIPITMRDCGGRRGRKLVFCSDVGHVHVRMLRRPSSGY